MVVANNRGVPAGTTRKVFACATDALVEQRLALAVKLVSLGDGLLRAAHAKTANAATWDQHGAC